MHVPWINPWARYIFGLQEEETADLQQLEKDYTSISANKSLDYFFDLKLNL